MSMDLVEMHMEQMPRIRADESLRAVNIATIATSSRMKAHDVNSKLRRWEKETEDPYVRKPRPNTRAESIRRLKALGIEVSGGD